ncbi:hypothetical protein BD408DRAFT_480717 [Parasitella parasitica]|nr:hypothetical protein BD408DRAFT_480717 [Parasitella parasitica]
MQGLLSYYEYEQVICISITEHKDLRICRSSNRLIEMEEIKRIGVGTVINKQCGIFVRNLFSKYFQSLSGNRQKCVISSATSFMEELRLDLIQDNRTIFDKSQILVCLPLGWTEDKRKSALRVLFSAAGWITKEDHENRLIFSTYLERLVNYLQDQNQLNKRFERERKYLFCHINETFFRQICIQMQSANELVAVSRKLASSDFLLAPTILDDESISLASLDAMIYSKVRNMITGTKDGSKSRIQIKPAVHALIGKIVKCIAIIYDSNKDGGSCLQVGAILSEYSNFFKHKAAQTLLKGWTCGAFINEILNDANIKQFIQDGLGSLQRILDKYSSAKDSPEGVQDIVLYTDCETSHPFHKRLIRDILLDANVIDSENKLISVFDDMKLCEGAMQKPYKIIQIANANLPPIIWNDDRHTAPQVLKHGCHSLDLLPSNSFYLQAHIYRYHVEFILNKVVAETLVEDVEQKATFTVQEETLVIENILDSACDIIWSHYQALDFDDEALNSCCDNHSYGMSSAKSYNCFSANFKTLMSKWLQNEHPFSGKEIDMYQNVSISDSCACSLNTTQRLVLEIGLKPAVREIAASIVSSLAANDMFGAYNVAALIMTWDNNVFASNPYYDYHVSRMFKESLNNCLQTHQRNLVIFLSRETVIACKTLGIWRNGRKQIFGRGDYTQLSSASYGIKYFAKDVVKQGSFSGIFEYDGSSYSKNKVTRSFLNLIILSRDDRLTNKGYSKILVLHNYDVHRIGLYTSNSLENDANWQRIWFQTNFCMNYSYPLTVKISPQSHSSTIKVEFTYIESSQKNPILQNKTIIIHERLILTQT